MRLVDADALEREGWLLHRTFQRDKDMMVYEVKKPSDFPTIEERKEGEWIDNHTTCSECGWQMIDDVMESPNMVGFNYCPNCGADMRGEGEQNA